MIENVLFLARAQSPQFELQRVSLQVGAELSLVAEYFEVLADEQGATITVTGEAQIWAERDLFRRAVSNLLANALRYTGPGGLIELNVKSSDSGTVIAVSNPGPGISQAELPRVFDRFYRADPARSVSGASSGLGLAIVKTIMDLHGGSVGVESEVGGLTIFRMEFPRIVGSTQGR
jgi:two-component system heavy metal sensor histidine kinase CusS